MPARSDIEHLLRRTEYIARPQRVSALMAKPSLAAAVDDVLAVPADPGSATLNDPNDWARNVQITHHWLDRMAHDSPRPMQEKMGFFWHGHFCTGFGKVGHAAPMQVQIDTFRRSSLGNLRDLAVAMSTQVAMLRYLDNNRNRRTSPNQNFARELLELFLLGVGNYTEADVEAGTAAWTGHTDDYDSDTYVWRGEWHDGSSKQFLGRTINVGGDPQRHGEETIDVVLGNGVVPAGAAVAANRGRPTRAVAAEFLSRKLWIEFAGTDPPAAVLAAMRDSALANDFALRPWVRTMLLRSEFYGTAVRQGLVRSPVEFIVACLAATGRRSAVATPIWLLEGMGQRPLFPPDVSGWKHNAYWVNASAMSQRVAAARYISWRTMQGYWSGDGLIHLAGGVISRSEVENTYRSNPIGLLDRILDLMRISLRPSSYDALRTFALNAEYWERADLVALVMLTPDFHVA